MEVSYNYLRVGSLEEKVHCNSRTGRSVPVRQRGGLEQAIDSGPQCKLHSVSEYLKEHFIPIVRALNGQMRSVVRLKDAAVRYTPNVLMDVRRSCNVGRIRSNAAMEVCGIACLA